MDTEDSMLLDRLEQKVNVIDEKLALLLEMGAIFLKYTVEKEENENLAESVNTLVTKLIKKIQINIHFSKRID